MLHYADKRFPYLILLMCLPMFFRSFAVEISLKVLQLHVSRLIFKLLRIYVFDCTYGVFKALSEEISVSKHLILF